MPKHREGHAHVVASLQTPAASNTGAHLPEARTRRDRGFVVMASVGLLVLLVIVALVGLSRALNENGGPKGDSFAGQHGGQQGDTDGSARGSGAQSDASGPASPGAGQEARQAVRRCAAAWAEDRGALHAGQPALRQWEVHIGVMNQLVAGQLTLDQASAFWQRTRMGAAQRVHRFQSTDQRLHAANASQCRTATAVDVAAGAQPDSRVKALRSCQQAVAATDETLTALRVAMSTWQGHIVDMNRLRRGTLDPVMAEHMWLRMWHRGQAEVRSYHENEARSAKLVCRSS